MTMIIKKMLVSQPEPPAGKSPYYDIGKKYGVEVEFRPFIKVEPINAKEFRQQRLSLLDYTAVIFTARTAVDHYFQLAEEMRITIPETMKYFCITETIAVYLQKYTVYRKRKVFYGQNGQLDDLVKLVFKHPKEKYIIPVSDVHKEDLMLRISTKKIHFRTAVMYRTVSNEFRSDEKFDYDLMLFFSPQGIHSLLKNFPDFKQDNMRIGCFGPTTQKTALDAGLRLDIGAPTKEAPAMTTALDLYLKRIEKGELKTPVSLTLDDIEEPVVVKPASKQKGAVNGREVG
jgi:uroporphyrinogen-III synthase